jgi:phosphatidylglycerophosphate synthase
VYDIAFTRRVSIYITVALARFKVTPNQVSALGALVGAASCALMAIGSPIQLLVGVALLHLYAVLDSVDGELARMTRTFSLVGLFVEDLSAYLMINAFNLAVAWRLYSDGALVWPLVGAVGIAAFGRNVMPVARRALLKSIMTRRPPQPGRTAATTVSRSRVREFIHENAVHVTNHWMLVSTLLVLSVYDLISTAITAFVFGLVIGLFACREMVALVVMLRQDRLERELSAIYAAASQPPELNQQRLSGYQAL